jgi:hypothetical protein
MAEEAIYTEGERVLAMHRELYYEAKVTKWKIFSVHCPRF